MLTDLNHSTASAMSFREKSAWACLGTTMAVFVPYFAYVFRLFAREELNATSAIAAFVAAVIWQIVLNTAAHVGIAIRSSQEQKDERDIAIESKSFRNAYFVLSIFIWAVVFVPTAPVLMSQMVLLCFIVAEATKYLTQVVCYRRGS